MTSFLNVLLEQHFKDVICFLCCQIKLQGVSDQTPGYTLDVNGTGNFATSLTVAGATGGVVPSGAVMFFNLTACPTGWTALTAAAGRVIVGRAANESIGSTVGTALSSLENRVVGPHTHTITDPGHMHNITVAVNGGTPNVYAMYATGGISLGAGYTWTGVLNNVVNNNTTGISINNTGTNISSTAGTNAPYIQYLVCSKN